jgi:hypothetical protein
MQKLVSKIKTYLSDKMHLKKVITKTPAKLGLSPKSTVSQNVRVYYFKNQLPLLFIYVSLPSLLKLRNAK